MSETLGVEEKRERWTIIDWNVFLGDVRDIIGISRMDHFRNDRLGDKEIMNFDGIEIKRQTDRE